MNRRRFFSALAAIALAPVLARFPVFKTIPNGFFRHKFIVISEPAYPEYGYAIMHIRAQ